MKIQQKINWKQGMEITPEIFTESDNYHIAERKLLGTLLASHSYGIFPNSKFSIDYEIHNQEMTLRISNGMALVKNGEVINIQENISFSKELPVNEAVECYVVLSVIHNDKKQPDENALYVVPQHDISFVKTNDLIENGIPILKICKKTLSWEIDVHYIPPSMALNSLPSLMNKYIEIKDIICKIIDNFAEKDANYFMATLLQLDLNNFSSQKSPEALTQLMKKFCLIFQTYLKNVKKIEPLQSVKKFIDFLYNHNEIEKIIDVGMISLTEILKIIETRPVPEIEEIKI